MGIKRRKLSSLNEDQLDTLDDLLTFLKKLCVIGEYYVETRRYHDTVTTHKNIPQGLGLVVDSEWVSFYDIERIMVVNGYLDSDGPL